jgi:hypothetical protein
MTILSTLSGYISDSETIMQFYEQVLISSYKKPENSSRDPRYRNCNDARVTRFRAVKKEGRSGLASCCLLAPKTPWSRDQPGHCSFSEFLCPIVYCRSQLTLDWIHKFIVVREAVFGNVCPGPTVHGLCSFCSFAILLSVTSS